MNRNYDNGTASDVILFVGTEVENTPMKGRETLFVVGIQDAEKLYWHCSELNISHVYLGANMSFDGENIVQWMLMAQTLLKKGIWVTLDFDIRFCTIIAQTGLNDFNNFIPMISAKIPHSQLFNYNTCVKIDDSDFAASNPGVWVHSLNELKDRAKFTDWSKYTQDKVVERAKKDVDQNEIKQ